MTEDETNKKGPKATRGRRALSLQATNACSLIIGTLLSIIAIVTVTRVLAEQANLNNAHKTYEDCIAATTRLTSASNKLTSDSRMFVMTGRRSHLDSYLHELLNVQSREEALSTLREYITDNIAYIKLSEAYEESSRLSNLEIYAMRLATDAYRTNPVPKKLREVRVNENDMSLPNNKKLERAEGIVLGTDYQKSKNAILNDADECTVELIAMLEQNVQQSQARLDGLLASLRIIVYTLLGIILFTSIFNYWLIARPMRIHSERITQNEPLDRIGARELHQLVDSYNAMYAENHRRTMDLKHEAETDGLTGLHNRGSYDKIMEQYPNEDVALILADVDLFKLVNDNYGHTIGDEVLKRVAQTIADQFRTSDYACRIGGDEFAVIMTRMNGVKRDIVESKLRAIASVLREPKESLPKTTLSIGVAVGYELPSKTDLFDAADRALYAAKDNGRNQYVFFEG